MKPKGSKYARKHYIKLQSEQREAAAYPLEFSDFFENHHNFEKRFLKLSYVEQINLIACLYNFAMTEDKHYGLLSSRYLNKIHELTDSDYEEGVCEPVAVDEKRLVRMDCYGSIPNRSSDQLSELYKYFRNKPKKKRYLLRDYDLESSPSWRIFAQFENFRKIAAKVKKAVYKLQISPDVLKIMTVNDYCDVLYNMFENGGKKARFVDKEDSLKNRYIKQFMKECGEGFYQALVEKGIDERAVWSLCNKMRRFGSCNLETLVVTEINYTPRILKDLKKKGYDVSGIKSGMPIAESFINYLIDNEQADLIIARNSDGSLVNKYALPRLELHHGKAVQFADSEYLASSNYPNRFVLIESQMHHFYYHLFDSVIEQNNIQNYFSRLNISSKYVRMRFGFASDDALFGDFENTAAFRKRSQEDKAHRVNYFEMEDARLSNVLDIIEKYGLDFRKFGTKSKKNAVNKKKLFKRTGGVSPEQFRFNKSNTKE